MREQKEKCIFYKKNKDGINDCSGILTRHHVRFKCEGGSNDKGNLVPMCQGHQRFVHSKDTWGGEDFSYLRNNQNSTWMKRNERI